MLSKIARLVLIFVVSADFAKSQRCIARSKVNQDKYRGNSIIGDQHVSLLPYCVTPIEHQISGRFKSGVADGHFEAVTPPWFNATLATIGQRFAADHWFSTNIGMIMAELVVAAQKDTSHTLYYFGSVETMGKAVRRFTANILQDSVWYAENLHSMLQNQDTSNLLQSLTKVKTMHLSVLNKLSRNKTTISEEAKKNLYQVDQRIWSAFEKDMAEAKRTKYYRPIPSFGTQETPFKINQFGMTSTLWGLAAMLLIRPKQFAIPPQDVTDENVEGFLHFWAFIGHTIGIEDEYNVCLQPNAKAAKVYFERFLQELLVPYLFNMAYEGKVIVEVSAKGFTQAVGPVAQFDFILRRMLEDVVGIPCPNLIANMTPMGRTIDTLWRRFLRTVMGGLKSMRSLVDNIYNGYIQNLSKREFGFDGTNKSIVAEAAFSW